MISLEQVRQLDARVKNAVSVIQSLREENAELKRRVSEQQTVLDTLEREASSRKADVEQLEVSLQGVLDVLDEVDNTTSDIHIEPEEHHASMDTVSEKVDDESGNLLDKQPPPHEESGESDETTAVQFETQPVFVVENEQTSSVEPFVDVHSPNITAEKLDEENNAKDTKDEQFQSEFDIF